MKSTIYKYICGCFLALALVACDDQLNLEPFDNIDTSLAFESNTDFENAIRGAYSFLQDENYYGGEFLLLPDVISDNLILCSEGRTSYSNYYYFNMNGNLAWLNFFRAAYDVILRSNYVLENIDNLEDGDFKENIRGQALLLRAMAHFDLARVYAKAPQYASSTDFGIAYVTSTDANQVPSRGTVAETFDSIEDDLIAGTSAVGDDNGVGFLNKTAGYALMSRFYLYTGDYAATITASDNAIATGTGDVSSIDDFPLIWTDETENGVIFKVINTTLDDVGVGVVYNQSSPDGIRSEYVPDFDFFNEFIAGDIRSGWFQTSSFAGVDFNHIIKYLQRPGSSQAVVDMKVLRWSEVYLNKAEAHAALDQDALALTAVDRVRSRRYATFTSLGETGNTLDAAIQQERRLELAFEGHRLFDLKRQQLDINRSNNGDYADGTGINPPADILTLTASDPLFQMPIPQEELNVNPNMQPNPSNN